jgi:hypothetical protein
MDSQPESQPQDHLIQALFGFMITQAVSAAATLGVADALKAGPLYYTDLASTCGCDQRSLHRTMRALSSIGIFDEPEPGRFANNAVSDLLREDHPASMRGLAVMIASESHWLPWGRFTETLRTGLSGPRHVFGEDIFSWFQREANSEQARIFNDAMSSFSRLTAPMVAECYDFSRFKRIVDIGGGHGLLLRTILAAAPQASGMLFDLPSVVEGADDFDGRIECVSGDFFKAVPDGGDCYIMQHILHDWSDEHCRILLSNIAKAMDPAGVVLAVEVVMPETPGPHQAKFADLNMLAMTEGGCERTEREFRELFQSAGLSLKAVNMTPMEMAVIEGVKA